MSKMSSSLTLTPDRKRQVVGARYSTNTISVNVDEEIGDWSASWNPSMSNKIPDPIPVMREVFFFIIHHLVKIEMAQGKNGKMQDISGKRHSYRGRKPRKGGHKWELAHKGSDFFFAKARIFTDSCYGDIIIQHPLSNFFCIFLCSFFYSLFYPLFY